MSPEEPTGSGQPVRRPPSRNRQRPQHRPPRRRVSVPKNPEAVGFLCDVMLGRLARELRLLGIDCEYDRNLGGMVAYREARKTGRVFLTRANKLRTLPGAMFVQSQVAVEQVAQVKAEIAAGLKPVVPIEVEAPAAPQQSTVGPTAARPRSEPVPAREPERPAAPPPEKTPAFGRCLECNAPLEKISREQARPSVPFFVYQIHHEFRRCPKCRRVFWPGNHVANMQRRVHPGPQGPQHRRHRT